MPGHGKLLPLSDAVSVLSSSSLSSWQGMNAQHYRLNPTECSAHASPSYSLIVQLSPPVAVEWQSRGHFHKRQLSAGDISLHAVGELPGFRLYQPVELFEIVLTAQFVNQVLESMGTAVSVELISTYGIIDPQIQRIAALLKAEAEIGCPGGQLLGESLAIALTAHLFTHYSNHPSIQSKLFGGLSKTDLQRVLVFIHDNLAEDLTLSLLASVVNLSPHHFALRFKQSIGHSPHQYVIQQRIEKAKRLLFSLQLPIGEIANLVGFANQSHLNLHFKRRVGVTPSQYRRSAR